ncbi:MAG: hypothetical protein NC898_06725 [Candidatus Omnitrophica bacterium]|nr:hypothetical protein [Candidatus Omnitrophota bacterium]MCM8794127.1 hypothetical protein [Candidatus Omnitrophota bacterium]
MKKSFLILFSISFPLFVALTYLTYAVEQKEPEQTIKFLPTTIEADRNYDGKVDRREYYEAGVITKTETDTDFDGIFDETVYFKAGKPVKAEKDTNRDGKPDTWITY